MKADHGEDFGLLGFEACDIALGGGSIERSNRAFEAIERGVGPALTCGEVCEVALDDRSTVGHLGIGECCKCSCERAFGVRKSTQIEEGFRAIAIELGREHRIGGNVLPGAIEMDKCAGGIIAHAADHTKVVVGAAVHLELAVLLERSARGFTGGDGVGVATEASERAERCRLDACALEGVAGRLGDLGCLRECDERLFHAVGVAQCLCPDAAEAHARK